MHFFGEREAQSETPEEPRCGNDAELRETRGLKYRGWVSVRGLQQDYWESGS
jgi:hypothetical protein